MTSKISLNAEEQIGKGISILKRGGVVAYPTDTVYGLGAGIRFPESIKRIYSIKNRPLSMPLPLLVADIAQLNDIAESVPPLARQLIARFWPGGLTIVLPASISVPEIITAGGKTIAVRIPAHPVTLALIKGLGTAVVGTSANLSGQPSPRTADEVYSQLGDKVDFIVNGGQCPGGKESTIIDVNERKPIILREGAIAKEEIERVFGKVMEEKR